MLMDIFSSFDEQNFTFMSSFPLIWVLGALPIIFFHMQFWAFPSWWNLLVFKPKGFMISQISRTSGKNILGFFNIVVSIFIILVLINLSGLMPYVFSVSSHLSFAFSLGLPLWFSLILSGVFMNFYEVISHLLPAGAPGALSPFLILVETISICVRPLTLSIRLVANMSAGHIILGLIGVYLSSGIYSYSLVILMLLMFVEVFYFMFEVGISLIQAYIFSLLITLYSDDHPLN